MEHNIHFLLIHFRDNSLQEHDKMYKEIEDLVGKMTIEDPMISAGGSLRRSSRFGTDENFVVLNRGRRRSFDLPRTKCISSIRQFSDEIPSGFEGF